MIGIVLSMHELVQSAFTPGACADAITKVKGDYTRDFSLTDGFIASSTLHTSSNRYDKRFGRELKMTSLWVEWRIVVIRGISG